MKCTHHLPFESRCWQCLSEGLQREQARSQLASRENEAKAKPKTPVSMPLGSALAAAA